MPARHRQPRRQLRPELENDRLRSPALGYESADEAGVIRCLAHGFPTPLARWHYHDEYELHLIVATTGKSFVGDWIGQFESGHLVLTGPRLPHNWISIDPPGGSVAERDLVIQFPHEPIEHAARHIPELAEVLPLLERSRHGIERFTEFCAFLADLAACTDYRLLSNVQLQGTHDDRSLDRIDAIVSRVTRQLDQPLSAAEVAAELGMTESRFSRFFHPATGNTFTDFVNRVRISRACQLLMESDRKIADICYVVGFNNLSNFNRRFLSIKGMTPRDFRRQVANRFGGRH